MCGVDLMFVSVCTSVVDMDVDYVRVEVTVPSCVTCAVNVDLYARVSVSV